MAQAYAPTPLLRAVRSDQLRGLVRRAVDQGWDLYANGGGHLAAVNPTNGARVVLSMTTNGTGHALGNTRQAFARAGLDLRPKAERRRALRQEARPMQVHDVTPTAPAPVTPLETEAPNPRAGQGGKAGGKFARSGPTERLDVGGYLVRAWPRADGTWVAETPDLSKSRRLRSWYGQDRDQLLARVAEGIAEDPPRLVPAADEVHVTTAQGLAADMAATPEPVEYPLAAALDALDAALAPGLAALVAAGRTDAAELVRAELTRSPLEDELLRLFRRVMTGA